jgi:hypothetical protein
LEGCILLIITINVQVGYNLLNSNKLIINFNSTALNPLFGKDNTKCMA